MGTINLLVALTVIIRVLHICSIHSLILRILRINGLCDCSVIFLRRFILGLVGIRVEIRVLNDCSAFKLKSLILGLVERRVAIRVLNDCLVRWLSVYILGFDLIQNRLGRVAWKNVSLAIESLKDRQLTGY